MHILAIGDPHGNLTKIKKLPLNGIDAIILTGDLGDATLARNMFFTNKKRAAKGLRPLEYTAKDYRRAYMQEYTSTLKVLRYLVKFAPVYTIFGNVEHTPKETKQYAKQLGLPLPDLTNALKELGVRIINAKKVRIKGKVIAGIPYFVDDVWAKEFAPGNKELYREAKKETTAMNAVLQAFGRVDVLVCHQPPLGMCDTVTAPFAPSEWKGKHAGSRIIAQYIKRHKPQYVVCGHIHEGKGRQQTGTTTIFNLGTAGHAHIYL